MTGAHSLPSPPLDVRLHCHPATPAGVALSLAVSLRWQANAWQLRYSLHGPLARLRIPAPGAGGPADGLWRHTCFEAFVAAQGAAAYREFNFSPSGQWAAYPFAAERQRDRTAPASPPPELRVAFKQDALHLFASLPLAALPPAATGAAAYAVGLCAVVEEADGRLSYWALHHPSERPDFHHHGGRTLGLAAP